MHIILRKKKTNLLPNVERDETEMPARPKKKERETKKDEDRERPETRLPPLPPGLSVWQYASGSSGWTRPVTYQSPSNE